MAEEIVYKFSLNLIVPHETFIENTQATCERGFGYSRCC